jgi:protein-S-isoprenylcysteine O-methyltransferase Ste14
MIKSWKDYLFVSIQFLLFGLYAFDFIPKMEFPKTIATLGGLLAVFGFMISVLAVFELKSNLTVFPTPKSNAILITNGLYRFSRNPIYSGILIFTFGFALYSYSLYRLLIFGCLAIWFYLKSTYEEKQLAKVFKDYESYKQKVGRFFPKIK